MYILFAIGFILLVKGADLLVDGSVAIAKTFNISNIVIGLTIVALGTSLPELIVNLVSVFQGSTDIAVGNILGSNIANVLLILGVSSLIYPITAKKNTVIKEIPFSLLAVSILAVLANDTLIDGSAFSRLTRIDGLVLLGFFIIFMYYTFGITKSDAEIVEKDSIEIIPKWKSGLFIVLGLIGLAIGGKWIVDGAILIALNSGLSESIIGLTIVAIGTSLPELATSAVAALKKQSDIAIGNVVGSNIFNIFFVLGISALIQPLEISNQINTSVIMSMAVSLILFVFMLLGRKRVLEKWQGATMLVIYFIYLMFITFII